MSGSVRSRSKSRSKSRSSSKSKSRSKTRSKSRSGSGSGSGSGSNSSYGSPNTKTRIRANKIRRYTHDTHGNVLPLHKAVYDNDVVAVNRLLREHPEHMNERSSAQFTPLHSAIINNCHKGIIRRLIDAGADTNTVNDVGDIPLNAAVLGEDVDLVRMLLMRADVNKGSSDGYRPLHYAAIRCNKEIIQLLISAGADFHVKTAMNQTPLDMLKTTRCNDERVAVLLR